MLPAAHPGKDKALPWLRSSETLTTTISRVYCPQKLQFLWQTALNKLTWVDVAEFLFKRPVCLCPKEMRKFSQQPRAWGGWSSPRQNLFTQENLWICQAGGEKYRIFTVEKYWARWFFMCFNTQWSCAHGKHKNSICGLFGKEEGKECM